MTEDRRGGPCGFCREAERKAAWERKKLLRQQPDWKGRIKAAASVRRAQRLKQATPQWADKSKIRDVYQQAKEEARQCGYVFHVDHIVPIYSEVVCGLHVHYNLRVIPARVNIKKGTRHWQ